MIEGMTIRRIFASSIAALLLLVTPLAVACDLSCAFSFTDSDCHAAQVNSASSGTNVNGMSMPGMDMPEAPAQMGQPADSSFAGAHAAHASIGDMGPCERQACASRSAVSVRNSRSGDSRFQVLLATTGTHGAEAAPALFRVARDEITSRTSGHRSALRLNLRI